MTQLSVKTLRHYHDVELLEPHHVDPATGYRYYTADQVPTAQVVRRLRDLDMPLADVRAVLTTAPAGRSALIARHLERLEHQLAETRTAVESLRAFLEPPHVTSGITHRSEPATSAAAITAAVDREELLSWWSDAVNELRSVVPVGAPAALFGFDVFAADRGEVTVFVATDGEVPRTGRVRRTIIPAAELAVIVHRGSHDDVDLEYSALGEYATSGQISVDGPLREYYDRFFWDTDDPASWQTRLCWPIFRTLS
jgi:DNA-binding transcriptional MerR regulator